MRWAIRRRAELADARVASLLCAGDCCFARLKAANAKGWGLR